jgi:hypothetical protein
MTVHCKEKAMTKIVVSIALSLGATLIAVVAARMVANYAFRAESPVEATVADPAPAI